MFAKSSWFAKLIWTLKRWFGNAEREQCRVECDDCDSEQSARQSARQGDCSDRGVFAI